MFVRNALDGSTLFLGSDGRAQSQQHEREQEARVVLSLQKRRMTWESSLCGERPHEISAAIGRRSWHHLPDRWKTEWKTAPSVAERPGRDGPLAESALEMRNWLAIRRTE